MEFHSKIYVAGHSGMVGSAIMRKLRAEGYFNLIIRTSEELDLRDQGAVSNFFSKEKPEYVFLAAARVGGILANNTFRADFIYENLMIECNVIHQSYLHRVRKLLFLGSSCIYPKLAAQPLREEELLSGYPEKTNEPYAIAKIAGIKLCENYWNQYGCKFISVMPTNLYGPNDNYDLNRTHVVPALIRKNYDALVSHKQEVQVWGSGKPLREFLHVDDLANACLFLMINYEQNEIVNVGSGEEISIKGLAELIKEIVGFTGDIVWDHTKPDGALRKVVDSTKIRKMGWNHRFPLRSGLESVYKLDFLINHAKHV
jgi:GDP-L-fucose synthase